MNDILKMTAPCGLACFACPVHLAGENPSLRRQVAQSRRMPEAQVQCQGCRQEEGCIGFLGNKTPCSILTCTRERGIDLCAECQDFPCAHLHPLEFQAERLPHNLKIYNCLMIKQHGLENWAKKHAAVSLRTYYSKKPDFLELRMD